MVCPTCENPMMLSGILLSNDHSFHCQRCGTMVVENAASKDGEPYVYVPTLVDCCRKFERESPVVSGGTFKSAKLWRSLGIAECIHAPADRG